MNGKVILVVLAAVSVVFAGCTKGNGRTHAEPTKTTTEMTSPQPPIAAGELVIQGKIKSITKAPTPGSQPYKDCIIATELQVTKVVSGTLKAHDILVYIWGLRDDRPVNSTLDTGKTVLLKLMPWTEAEGKYGGYYRIEPANDDAFLLDAYWGDPRS